MKAWAKQNAFIKFILLATCLYVGLFLIYQFGVRRFTFYDQKFIGLIIRSVETVLSALGYRVFTVLQDRDLQVIGIDGSNGVWVGSNCNAITLFTLFVVFVVAYPGNQKDKLWFVPLGLLAIHVLNLLRVMALVLIAYYAPQYLDFNHTYTFTFLVYAFIFWLWILWTNRFSGKTPKAAA